MFPNQQLPPTLDQRFVSSGFKIEVRVVVASPSQIFSALGSWRWDNSMQKGWHVLPGATPSLNTRGKAEPQSKHFPCLEQGNARLRSGQPALELLSNSASLAGVSFVSCPFLVTYTATQSEHKAERMWLKTSGSQRLVLGAERHCPLGGQSHCSENTVPEPGLTRERGLCVRGGCRGSPASWICPCEETVFVSNWNLSGEFVSFFLASFHSRWKQLGTVSMTITYGHPH